MKVYFENNNFMIACFNWIFIGITSTRKKITCFYISQLDIGTVYAQQDHRFVRRWAVLTDPDETLGASGAGVKVNWF